MNNIINVNDLILCCVYLYRVQPDDKTLFKTKIIAKLPQIYYILKSLMTKNPLQKEQKWKLFSHDNFIKIKQEQYLTKIQCQLSNEKQLSAQNKSLFQKSLIINQSLTVNSARIIKQTYKKYKQDLQNNSNLLTVEAKDIIRKLMKQVIKEFTAVKTAMEFNGEYLWKQSLDANNSGVNNNLNIAAGGCHNMSIRLLGLIQNNNLLPEEIRNNVFLANLADPNDHVFVSINVGKNRYYADVWLGKTNAVKNVGYRPFDVYTKSNGFFGTEKQYIQYLKDHRRRNDDYLQEYAEINILTYYRGKIKNHERIEGVFSDINNNIYYDGQFKNNKYHGFGKLIDRKGNVYEGQFKMGKFHGYGKQTIRGIGTYEGQFRGGHHKHVIFISADGQTIERCIQTKK